VRRFLRWMRNGLLALLGLVALGSAGIYVVSELRLRRSFTVEAAPISVPQGAAAIEEGRRLFVTRGCADCHGPTLAGQVVIDNPLLGTISASNLTTGRGGVGGQYTSATWARAIRHGIGPNGRPLLVMPSQEFVGMSDADIGAIIAFLASAPPQDHERAPTSISLLARGLYLAGQAQLVPADLIDHTARPDAPAAAVSVEYGRYLAASCMGCHGPGFSGGPVPGAAPGRPLAANLTPDAQSGIGAWSEADFIRALREGVRPDGSAISDAMPWKNFGRMNDTELKALYRFLRQVPARPHGNR
jgi:mono/diheme cytochrome c family protein